MPEPAFAAFFAVGLPSMVTVDAPLVRSAALKMFGSGVGMGPAGGEGGHRQTSGIAIPWAELPAWTAAIPLMKTLSPIAAQIRRDVKLRGRY